MLLLSIDTSTTVCSVALHENGVLLGCYELFTERTSSAMLTTLISDLVEHTAHELSQLDAIAVAKGPGSYTGLRIGVSTAKGLCFALDKPLVAINSLQAMAEQVRGMLMVPIALCPMLDARRMEVYCAVYDANGSEIMPTTAKIIDETSFADILVNQSMLFFGDGAAKCRLLLNQHPTALFLETPIQPSARTVGVLATHSYKEGRFEDMVGFEPFYLKDFMGTKPKQPIV